jgi:hypothetical protein
MPDRISGPSGGSHVAPGAIEMPRVIADDARLGEQGFAGDMRAVRGM